MRRTIERVGPGEFDGVRLKRPGRWAVAFLADWCPFCRAFEPQFAALDGAGARLLVADMTDLESPLWDAFRVEVVPTVVVFEDGAAGFREDGVAGVGILAPGVAKIRAALGAAPRSRGDAPSGRTRRPRRTTE